MENIQKRGPRKRSVHYARVTEAIDILRQQGYTTDFNLAKKGIRSDSASQAAADFEIRDIYRYEGNSDPADEATVYAIVSSAGIKGILATGYGDNSATVSAQLLEKLHY
ncbi:hypothetical protein A0256_00955 [Mucilaginibacter sp. PAMC 26640]|nr:hypothetical protein A0256_00955 [Mucilaginibacter sp. PAMC 26640]